jgi:hypothetical protein
LGEATLAFLVVVLVFVVVVAVVLVPGFFPVVGVYEGAGMVAPVVS